MDVLTAHTDPIARVTSVKIICCDVKMTTLCNCVKFLRELSVRQGDSIFQDMVHELGENVRREKKYFPCDAMLIYLSEGAKKIARKIR